jgi:SAM-dependent methyltransferase
MSYEYKPDIFSLSDAVTPWAVRAAATLRLADLIGAGATKLEDLASKSGADADTLRRLMRYLVVRGVFTEEQKDTYGLTEAGAMLKDDHPQTRRHWLDVDGVAGRIEGSFIRLTDSIRTGDASYPLVYGKTFYDDLAGDGELALSFNGLMATHAEYFDKVVGGFNWTEAKHVYDIGGGTGALLTEILKANTHLRGTLVDLATVVKQAESRFAGAGLTDRVSVFGGSIFETLPAGGDVYVLSNVLHDWNDRQALEILKRTAEAAGANGRVLVVQILVAEEGNRPMDFREKLFITQMDLRLLALMGGRERTYDEFAALGAQAGLKVKSSTKVESGQTLLEFVKA